MTYAAHNDVSSHIKEMLFLLISLLADFHLAIEEILSTLVLKYVRMKLKVGLNYLFSDINCEELPGQQKLCNKDIVKDSSPDALFAKVLVNVGADFVGY